MKGKSIAVEEVPASKTPSDPPESKETGYELPDLAEQRMLLFNMPTGISKKEMLTTFAYVDGSYSLPVCLFCHTKVNFRDFDYLRLYHWKSTSLIPCWY